MAKSFDDLFPQLIDFGNLYSAWRKAARGKRGGPAAAGFEMNLSDELIRLQRKLAEQTWRPGPYHSFVIRDPKERLVSAAPFRDRVAHHALCNVTEAIFENAFIADSYANRKGKGTHAALDKAQSDVGWVRRASGKSAGLSQMSMRAVTHRCRGLPDRGPPGGLRLAESTVRSQGSW